MKKFFVIALTFFGVALFSQAGESIVPQKKTPSANQIILASVSDFDELYGQLQKAQAQHLKSKVVVSEEEMQKLNAIAGAINNLRFVLRLDVNAMRPFVDNVNNDVMMMVLFEKGTDRSVNVFGGVKAIKLMTEKKGLGSNEYIVARPIIRIEYFKHYINLASCNVFDGFITLNP